MDLDWISWVMVGRDKKDKKTVLTNYPLPFKYPHRTSKRDVCKRYHSEWVHSQASDWKKVEKNDKMLNQLDYAFCELQKQQHLIEIQILRF